MFVSSKKMALAGIAGGMALAALGAGSAKAQTTITGSAAATISTVGLSFTPATFTGTTSNGFLAFSNLGVFNLTGSGVGAGSVSLLFTFTAPTASSTATVATTSVTGSFTPTAGGLFLDFDNTPKTITFTQGGAPGSFQFIVDDLSVQNSAQSPAGSTLTGRVINAGVVPEPGTMALAASALLPLAGAVIRRRRSN